MIRDGILKTKRHELGNIVVNRKRKLQELYHATVALAGPNESSTDISRDENQSFNEAAFLDANDLLKGRYFDVNTIFRIQGRSNDLGKFSTASTALEKSTASSLKPVVGARFQDATLASTIGSVSASQASRNIEPNGSGALPSSSPPQQSTSSLSKTSETSHDTDVKASEGLANDKKLQDGKESGREGRSEQSFEAERTDQENSHAEDRIDGARPIEDITVGGHVADQIPFSTIHVAEPKPFGQGQVTHTGTGPGPGSLESAQSMPTPVSPNAFSGPSAQLRSEAANSTQLATQSDIRTDANVAKEKPRTPAELSNGVLSTGDNLRFPPTSTPEANLAERRSPSKQQNAHRKGNMRIDTDIGRSTSLYNAQLTSGSTTPIKSAQVAMQSSPPEPVTTRISSGALRHKSVSEILNGTPRSALGEVKASSGILSPDAREIGTQTPYSGRLIASPDSSTFRSHLNEVKEKEKDRSKLSAVVFPRQQLAGSQGNQDSKKDGLQRREKALEPKDYLVTLFATQASAQTPSLNDLMASSSKILSTDNHYLVYRETQDSRMLKRIYHLQNFNRWSLRQMERSKEPERPLSHWDTLLGEAEWMRTDFREERKWKIATAKNLANWCAEWVSSCPEKQSALRVRVRKPSSLPLHEDSHITPESLPNPAGSSHSDATPDLVPSTVDDASDMADEDIPYIDVSRSVAPAALFSLAPEDVVFKVQPTPAADRLLEELPLYRVYNEGHGKKRKRNTLMSSEEGQAPLVPVSKYATEKMMIKEQGPVRKRSRYSYAEEDEIGVDSSGRTLLPLAHGKNSLFPEKDDVALFDPQNKHIISRLHAAHAFRPPSEFNMPSQSFFESRSPSQWTVAEDDQLRRLVREYEYNWSLIAACCSSPSVFPSSAERRTPWECFERWVSFEGLPGDMAKHQYFRAWNARRDSAREHLENVFLAQQRGNNASQTPLRRRTAEPVTVPQRRQTRHVALVHSMFKLAKKKEAAIQKQQHVASLAAMRKAAEPAQPRQRMQTPREFSAHKYKQECDYKEKQHLYKQQLRASQMAAMAQKQAQQSSQINGQAVPQVGRNGMTAQPNGVGNSQLPSATPNAIPSGSRAMPHPAMLTGAVSNGTQASGGQQGPRGASNVPQASMQSYLQGQQRLSAQSGQERVVIEAARLSEQQRAQQRQQQTQNIPLNTLTSASYNNNNNINLPLQHNAAMMANLQAANGKLSPAANGNQTQPRASSSPGVGPNIQLQQTPSSINPVLNQISSQYKSMHPTASPEQIKQMATNHLSLQLRNMQQHQQANNNSVAMNNNINLSPQQQMAFSSGPNIINPQIYAQYLRNQQASQQATRNGSAGGGSSSPNGEVNGMRPSSQGSVGATQNRSGSMPNGASQSPRPPQAQMTGPS